MAWTRNKTSAGLDVDAAYEAAQTVVRTHHAAADFLRPGLTLAEIDRFIAKTIAGQGGKSCFFGYRVPRTPPFPSHACLSVNSCIVHGHAAYYTDPLKPGDILKIDIGVTKRGWIGDAAWTYAIGEPSPEDARLMECGKECLKRGIQAMQPGNQLVEWARAVQTCSDDEYGFHMVKHLGGHGYGTKLHAPPYISNLVPNRPGEWPDATMNFTPGMLIAVEPMIAAGTSEIESTRKNPWPVHSAAGSQTVHYEADILITEDGPRDLTEGLADVKDVIDA